MASTLFRQIGSFAVSGVAASGLHYAVYLLLVSLGWLGPVWATTVGFCAGTVVSYLLNSRYTFTSELAPGTFGRFTLITLLGGALNTGLVALVEPRVHFAVAGVIGIVAGATFNFTGHRLWTFRRGT